MKRTISFMTGKGSVNHNSRKFHAKNTDPERSYLNIEYINENIEDVISLKNKNIYIKKEDYNFPGPLNEELYGKNVYDGNKLIGTLKEINNTSHQELLVIAGKTKEYLVPYVKPFIQKITNDGIYLNVIEGLIDED